MPARIGQTQAQRDVTTGLEPWDRIIATKEHHHGNLLARAVHDRKFDVYRISVLRRNSNEAVDLWGIYPTAGAVLAKFNLLVL